MSYCIPGIILLMIFVLRIVSQICQCFEPKPIVKEVDEKVEVENEYPLYLRDSSDNNNFMEK
jgi:hypothetical protein